MRGWERREEGRASRRSRERHCSSWCTSTGREYADVRRQTTVIKRNRMSTTERTERLLRMNEIEAVKNAAMMRVSVGSCE